MDHAGGFLLGLFVIFVAAQIGAEIAQRPRLPGVVREIAAVCGDCRDVAADVGRDAAALALLFKAETTERPEHARNA